MQKSPSNAKKKKEKEQTNTAIFWSRLHGGRGEGNIMGASRSLKESREYLQRGEWKGGGDVYIL